MHPTTSLSILWLLNTCVRVFCLQLRTCWSTWTPSSPITSPSPTPWSWSLFWLVRSRKCRELINQSNPCIDPFSFIHILKIHFCVQRRSSCCPRLLCWCRSAACSRCWTAPTSEVTPATTLFCFFLFLFLFYTDLLCQRLCVSGARDHVFPQHMLLSRPFVICAVLSVIHRCARTCHQAAAAVADSHQRAGEI